MKPSPLSMLKARYRRRAIEIVSGRNRTTYNMGRYVVKVPNNDNGCADNSWEGWITSSQRPGMPQYARTRLAMYGDVPVLFMEYVLHWSKAGIRAKDLPRWTAAIDCHQVGLNKNKRLVAYDYGIR